MATLGVFGRPWASLGVFGLPWASLDTLGVLGRPWGSLGVLGRPWATFGNPGLPWASLGYLGYLGLPWATLGYLGLPWATLGYIGLKGNLGKLLFQRGPKNILFSGWATHFAHPRYTTKTWTMVFSTRFFVFSNNRVIIYRVSTVFRLGCRAQKSNSYERSIIYEQYL
jgi:hypothetical protein